MAKAQKVVLSPEEKAEAKQKRWAQIKRDKWMYLLLLPGFLYFIIFKIVPMWGILSKITTQEFRSSVQTSLTVGLVLITSRTSLQTQVSCNY